MSNTNKQFIYWLIPVCLVIAVLIFFIMVAKDQKSNTVSNQANMVQDKQTDFQDRADNTNLGTDTGDDQKVDSNSTQTTTLSVDPDRCRGCGKCAMIDPEHFSMSGRTATVISTDNLNSSDLQQAISMCPAGAISLS